MPVEIGGTEPQGEARPSRPTAPCAACRRGCRNRGAAALPRLEAASGSTASSAEKEVLQHEPVTKELVDGEGFLYLGRSYRLKIVDAGGDVRLERGRLVLPQRLTPAGDAALIAWYRRCGETWIGPRAGTWAERLRVDDVPIEVRDLAHKWGAATAGRQVRIHWATLQLPPALVEYVLVHELAHLREPHHGPTFWELLARVIPDYEERKRDLARRGAALWFGGVS